MATSMGARSAGYENELGEIRPGQRADLVLFDINTVPFVPLNEPLFHLVYCLPSSAVDTVIVEGQVVVRGGSLTRVNEAELLGEGQELGREFLRRYDGTLDGPRRLFPAVARGYRRANVRDVGVNRRIGRRIE